MTRAEAQDELAHRWRAPTLMRAATAEYMHIRDWLPPIRGLAVDLADAIQTYDRCPCGRCGQCVRRRKIGGKAA